MNNILKVLAVLLAGILVFGAARYLDNNYGRTTPEIQDTQAAVAQTVPVTTEPQQTQTEPAPIPQETAETQPLETTPPEESIRTYVLTFAGDCVLGCMEEHNQAGYGFRMVVGEDYDYPFQNVRSYFQEDDLTLLNLEGVLTDEGYPLEKRFAFRGPEAYVNILSQNSVDVVSLANNHTGDYGEDGYKATVEALEGADIPYVEQDCGTLIPLEGGLTVGIYGTVYNTVQTDAVTEGIRKLKEEGADLIIYAPHWGTEYSDRTMQEQEKLAQAAIEAGADIVYGCHPHVLQPIEEYKDGVIYYSLGNFSFGGNIYPPDYDTALIQQEVHMDQDGTVTLGQRKIIPCSISSIAGRNNYQPTPYAVDSEEYKRVLSKLDGSFKGILNVNR